ncbi:MAG: ketoacyl-ACP synthase III [Candidatus Gastranaerophilales bacterium]|nr:ketoacyl-ACP synthase III [Candidatus Gastranaerophilales bacterium]
MNFKPTQIMAVGKSVPDTVITNDDLTKILDTSDEWISTRTGIKQRHIASGDENSTFFAVNAAKDALSKSDLSGLDIDLIIAATSNPFNIYPSTACAVQAEIGAKNAIAFDITVACTGMIYALEIARHFISSGKYKNALLVATDTNSKFLDWSDRSTCVLFGDGAGAVILSESKDGTDDILALNVNADGNLGNFITMNLIGENCPLVEPAEKGVKKISMNGKEVYKFVVQTMPESIMRALDDAGLEPKDIDYLIPHQANYRIIEGLQHRLEFTDEQVIIDIDKYGNTSAASVPIALADALNEGKIKTPSIAILCAFGAGMAWGSAVVRLRKGLK